MNIEFTAKQQHKIGMSHTIGQVVNSIKFPDTNDSKNVMDFIRGVAEDNCEMMEFPKKVSLFLLYMLGQQQKFCSFVAY